MSPRRRSALAVALALTALAFRGSDEAAADEVTARVFGPAEYVRVAGPPQVREVTFALPNRMHAPFDLIIAANRVSSAHLILNGVEVVSPSSFNDNVTEIVRPISLTELNVLAVRMAGQPGGHLTVRIMGTVTVEASGVVGPQGGEVAVTDASSALLGASVSIPPGALAADTRVSIEAAPAQPVPPEFEVAGPAVNFLPDGLAFAQPVTITVPRFDAATDSSLIYLLTEDGSLIPELGVFGDSAPESSRQFDAPVGNGLSVRTDHFSTRQVLSRPAIDALLATFVPGVPGSIPIPLAECGRCISPRQVPIQRIIVHSTNDGGQRFSSIIAWIHSSFGSQSEAFFATYYIDKSGRIVQLVDDSVQTAHIAGNNSGSIGIELYDGSSGYSAAQVDALVALTLDLMQRHSVDAADVLRHKDFTADPLHQDPYNWTDAEWQAFKDRLTTARCPEVSGYFLGGYWPWDEQRLNWTVGPTAPSFASSVRGVQATVQLQPSSGACELVARLSLSFSGGDWFPCGGGSCIPADAGRLSISGSHVSSQCSASTGGQQMQGTTFCIAEEFTSTSTGRTRSVFFPTLGFIYVNCLANSASCSASITSRFSLPAR